MVVANELRRRSCPKFGHCVCRLQSLIHRKRNASMAELSMDKLPQLINSLLAPLESDSIDDEEVQEKLMKSVLDVTHIFRTAASEKLLRFEDPTQHRSTRG